MANVIPRYSEGNKVEFSDKVSIWLNRAAGFFSKDARPETPSNFAVTAREYALLLTWTPDAKADYYNVYASSTNDVNAKSLVARLYGDVSSFVHYIGSAATRYYWLEANTNTGRVGELVQASGTSSSIAVASIPMVVVSRSTGQAIATGGSGSAISWTTEVIDNDTMFDGGQPTRLTIKHAGYYVINGSMQWDAGSGGSFRYCYIRGNGGSITTPLGAGGLIPSASSGLANRHHSVVSPVTHFAVNDYLELMALHDNGSDRNFDNGYFSAHAIKLD